MKLLTCAAYLSAAIVVPIIVIQSKKINRKENATSCLNRSAARKNSDDSAAYSANEKVIDGKVILSKILLILGAILTLICLIPIIVLALKGSVFPEIILLGFFCLFGVVLILGYLNCRVYFALGLLLIQKYIIIFSQISV